MSSPARLFELRTYHAAPGKIGALEDRFREHTLDLFARHGFELVGFWRPVGRDGEETESLVYLLAFADKAAADKAWAAFQADPDWVAARSASEQDGKLTASIESVFMHPTAYSPMM